VGASDKLSRLVDREAGKLLTISEKAETPLTEEHLLAVERLARAAKWLGMQQDAQPDPADDISMEEALALAGNR